MLHQNAVRYLILFVAVLVNLALARVASADLKNAWCDDPETGDAVPCCEWCVFLCHCDLRR